MLPPRVTGIFASNENRRVPGRAVKQELKGGSRAGAHPLGDMNGNRGGSTGGRIVIDDQGEVLRVEIKALHGAIRENGIGCRRRGGHGPGCPAKIRRRQV